MPPIYKLITCLVALVGDLSLITTGELNPLIYIPGSLMFVGYYRAIKGLPQAHRYLTGTLSTVVLLLFFFDAFYLSRDIIVGVSHMSILFHTLKSFDIKDPWDPLQVFFMSLIQLLLASELTRSLAFGAVFLLFIVLIVFAIFYSHLMKEGVPTVRPFLRPLFSIMGIVVLLTAIFFVSTPRLRGSLIGVGLSRGIRSGFSESIKLGGLEEVKLDPTVVMRVTVKPMGRPFIQGNPLYLRGSTFELYREDTWIDLDRAFQTSSRKYRAGPGGIVFSDARRDLYQEVVLEPLDSELLFYTGTPVMLQSEAGEVYLTEDGALSLPRKRSKRFRYIIYTTTDPRPVKGPLMEYLQLPGGLRRVKALAEEVAGGTSEPMQKAHSVEAYLRQNYTYSLNPSRVDRSVSPVEDFLFNTRRGYCEYYATAMVLMLRTLGIPARLVTGYLAVEYNQYGNYYIVRQRDAHTWVEAAVDGLWLTFDPTPSTAEEISRSDLLLFLDFLKMKWQRYVVGFSSYDQRRIAGLLARPIRFGFKAPAGRPDLRWVVYPVPVLFTAVLLIYLMRRHRLPPVSRFFFEIRRSLGGEPSITGTELLQQLPPSHPLFGELREFVLLYHRLRFSPRRDEDLFRRYEALYRSLRKALRGRSPSPEVPEERYTRNQGQQV